MFVLSLACVGAVFQGSAQAQTPAIAQSNASTFVPTSVSTTVPFTAAQSAGNVNVVAVSWNDSTAVVQTVTDTSGNPYTLAVGPTVDPGIATQAIYYAANILGAAAGANAVTVTFNLPAAYVDVRVAEYTGISAVSPIERTAAASGIGGTADSGALTASATNLLFAAATTQTTGINAGANFTSRLVTTRPSSIVVYVQDSFTGANGALAGHTPDVGGAWVPAPAGLALLNNQLEGANFGDVRSHNAITPPSADYDVAADVQINAPGWGNKGGVRGRDAGGFLANAYEAYFDEGAHAWALVRWSGFSQTVLGTFADPTFTSGTKRVTLRMVGAQITLLVNDVVRVNVTDAAPLLSAGHPGLYLSGGIHNGILLDNVVARSVGGVGGNANLLEDQVLAATGAVHATATLAPAGRWILQAIAFRNVNAPLPDVLPPSDPTSLSASAISSSQVNLTWTASTDNVGVTNYLVERCAGAACSSFAQVGTSPTPSFADSGLSSSTTYRYRVRATDAASNLSGYSNLASATTQAPPDTQAPTAPANLSATAVSPTQVNLAWTASTDNVGVTNYLVERCTGAACSTFAQIGTSATTSFGDTAATATTAYRYRVRATDAATNLGGYSNIAAATTPAEPDPQAPSQPTGLTATATSATTIGLSWTASTDNVGVTGYAVERCQGAGCDTFAEIGSTPATSWTDLGLASATIYNYRVRATDAATNFSPYSDPATTTTLPFTTITFVQGNATSFAPSSSVTTVPFTAAQSAGNVNLVVVSWNDTTAAIQTVTDTSGNAYTLAVGPTADAGVATQAIYYAANIPAAAAGANAVTVTFNVPAAYVDVRVAEYGGISIVSPIERTAAASGIGGTADSGAMNVSATNLLVAAATTQTTGITAGASFTSRIATTRPSSIVLYVQDSFTGANGALAGHTPEIGGSWVPGPAGLALLNNQLEGVNFGDVRSFNSVTPPSTDYEVAADVQIAIPGLGNKGGVRGRDAGGFLANAYEAYFDEGAHTWALVRWNGFGQTTLGTFADPTFTSGTKRVTLRMVGTQISLLVNSIARVTVTDAVLAGPGHPGLYLSGGIHNAMLLDNFVAQSVGGVGGNANLVEDQVLGATGSVHATATLAPAGRWILQAIAFRNASAPLPDTLPPSDPTGLNATPISATQITLAWTPSTDNTGVSGYLVERCTGAACTTFAQIGTSPTATFSDTTVVGSTTYRYRVRATDAASNLSGYSNMASATTPAAPDTQAPTAPTGLTATSASPTQVNLAWTASTDNVGVTNYLIERCTGAGCSGFGQIGTSATTAFSDTTTTGSTTYRYRVRATDAANNLGVYSNIATATTPAAPDTQAPSQPTGLTATATSATSISLNWIASTDNVGVTGYRVFRNGAQIATPATTSYIDNGLSASTTYSYTVAAVDAALNISLESAAAQATTLPGGGPTTVLASDNFNRANGGLGPNWTIIDSNPVIVNQHVQETFAGDGNDSIPIYTAITWPADHYSQVRVLSATSHSGCGPIVRTKNDPVIEMYFAQVVGPLGPNAKLILAKFVTHIYTELWSQTLTINSGDLIYLSVRGNTLTVKLNGTTLATRTDSSITDAGFAGLDVLDYDGQGAPGDGQCDDWEAGTVSGLTAPTNVTGQPVSTSQINLSWTASTGPDGVAGYRVFRNGADVGTTPTPSFSDTGLAVATSYTYTIHAYDSNGITSDLSPPIVATTLAGPPDTQAPSDPSALNATPASATSVSLTWTPSTDNVGVTNYLIERCAGAACSNFAQVGTSSTAAFSDGTLAGSTSYRYRVRATDAATNLSGYSNIANATTPAVPDTQAPTAPASLSATAASQNQVNLTWTAATDNVGVTNYLVERCTGAGCSSFGQIGTSAVTSFSDTTAAATITYRYRARATDAASNLGPYSNIATATTPAVPDLDNPSQPTGLTATATSATTIALSWTASTDNVGVTHYIVERCEGAGCSSFASVASPGTNSFNDSGLAAATTYRYRVQATDAASNLSPYSNVADATTLEFTTIAYVQGNASTFVPASSSTTVPFTAAQSAGNVNVIVVSWNDTTAAVQTVTDTNGNVYTLAVGPTVDAGVATQAIYYAANIPAAAAGNAVTVTFNVPAAYVDLRVAEYAGISAVSPIERTAGAAGIGGTADSGALTASATNLLVAAATTQTTGITAGAAFTSRLVTTRPSSIALYVQDSFTGANGALAGHTPELGGAWVPAPAGLALLNNQLEGVNFGDVRSYNTLTPPSADYEVAVDVQVAIAGLGNKGGVRGRDAGGFLANAYEAYFNEGSHTWVLARWNGFSQTTLGSFPDPTFTSGTKRVTLRMVGTQITLLVDGVARVNVTDAVLAGPGHPGLYLSGGIHNAMLLDNFVAQSVGGVGGNANLLEDELLASSGAVHATATLAPAGRWILQAIVFRNASAPLPDVLPPSDPSAVSATPISATQIALGWTPSTDNVGVTNYLIERCSGIGCATFAQVGTSPTAAFSDATVIGSTTYRYRVRASDATSNLSGYSNIAETTTPTAPDTQAPTSPSGLTATGTSPSQVSLAWTAATDNVGVTNYLVERCAGAACTTFGEIGTSATLSFTDVGLSSMTTYRYRVRATDAAANLGGYSNVANATTATPGTVSFIQGNHAAPSGSQATVALPFLGAQTGGNLNVVVVGWNDSTAQVQTIADGAGNQYAIAAGPTVYDGVATQVIYYAKNIAGAGAGTNSVTVTFSAAAATPNVRIAEYSGLDLTNPLVAAAAAQGSGATSDSGGVTTTEPHNLLVSAHQAQTTTDVGSGFTKRLPAGAAAGVTFVRDTMIGPSETPLTAHTPEIGGAWIEDQGGLTIRNNKAEGPNFGDGRMHNATTMPSADYEVSVDVTVNRRGLGNRAGVRGRDAGGILGNTYEAYFSEEFETWVLDRWFGFSSTQLGFYDDLEFTSGTKTLTLRMVGSSIKVLIDGIERIAVEDTAIAAPHFPGLRSSGGIHDGLLLSNFVVQSIPSGTPAATTFILEDRVVAEGTFNGTASVTAASPWIGQTVAFRAAPESALSPDLVLSNTHAGTFSQGQTGATYTLTASNNGLLATSGLVTVTDVLPAALTATALSGSGWDCTLSTLKCTRSDSLPPSSSYPPITLTVTIAGTAPSSVTNVATVSGGGEFDTANNTASSVTPIEIFAVMPATIVISPAQVQQFTVVFHETLTVTWSVDGIAGGSAAVGTITPDGLYTPPSVAGSHVITATTVDELMSATAAVFVSAFSGTFTHHNDNARTGQNSADPLTLASVTPATFGKLRSYDIDGIGMASPLYVPNVNIPGRGVRNVVFVATQHDSVYAFDADGIETEAFWQRSFIDPGAGITSVPEGDVGCCDPEVGIAGTPVIDPATGTLYVVAKTKENGAFVLRLHALDIQTGEEKLGGPVAITASVPGVGDGAAGGVLAFDPLRHNQRAALLLSGGVVYIAFASHSDAGPFHGWLIGYNATTLVRTMAFCATPDGYGGGIWLSNGGPATDADGNIYLTTGNGTFDANTGGRNYGNSILKLDPSGAVLDYFTPHDQATLEANDDDVGSAGSLVLPVQPGAHPRLLLHAGKGGTIYLVDRDNMGGYNAANDSQIVQSKPQFFASNFSSPVLFNGTVYFSAIGHRVESFTLVNGLLPASATSQSEATFSFPGGTLAISSNGTSNGILWAIQRNGGSSPGVLRAYDATNLQVELYNSNAMGARDALDPAAKFSVPLVAGGKVFVTTTGRLTIFGALP